jgi:pyruvate/2-oxoglutarate dehydrogenase complex dihydrolipoamide dehydrogenase (E3) component
MLAFRETGEDEAEMAREFDAIVIGAGQSGPFLAVRLAEAGLRTALIERAYMGGTCVNNGCIPTKTLIASARVAHVARRAAEYGVQVGPVSVDMQAVKARKDAIVAGSVKGLADWIAATPRLELIWGSAKFVASDAIEVNGETLTAPKIFLNTGGTAVVPNWPGVSDVPFLTNVSMMDIDTLPEHLMIVGGSYVSLEFAQMYRRFGAKVTVIEHGDRLIPREDRDISDAVRGIIEAEGIACKFGADGFSVARTDAGIALSFIAGGRAETLTGSHLLVAIGRKPNSGDLNLAAAGVATDKRGYIEVDDQLRTNVEGIWAMGDVNGKGAFTHTSYNDFQIVAANVLDNDPRRVSDRITAYNLYIDPPLGRVGMSETEVRASGRKALMAVMPMTRVGRAREKGETPGLLKVLVDAESKQILGAALLGIECDEVIHSLLDVMAAKAPYTVVERAMHIHPTVSELIPTLLGELKPLE